MSTNKETIDDRFTKIENDLEQMNKLIDENLKVDDDKLAVEAMTDIQEEAAHEKDVVKEKEQEEEAEVVKGSADEVENEKQEELTFVNDSNIRELNEMLEAEIDSTSVTEETKVTAVIKETEDTAIPEKTISDTAKVTEHEAENDLKHDDENEEMLEDTTEDIVTSHVESDTVDKPQKELEEAAKDTVDEGKIQEHPIEDTPELKGSKIDTALASSCQTSPEPKETDFMIEHGVDKSTTNDGILDSSVEENTAVKKSSSPMENLSPIMLPKNTAPREFNDTEQSNNKSSLRRTTNPFRVISVGAAHSRTPSGASSRVASANISLGNESQENSRVSSISSDGKAEHNVSNENSIDKLQSRHDYLIDKCSKLQKEINYLKKMSNQAMLSIEDTRKLKNALEKLQEYLDKKTKEKYDTGVMLSRHLRKQINRGEQGQFWISNK
ncbi:hypothetical protein TPHA_0F02240 [Tetrapisispora phaffii CBS 4417]|uniref:Uncharacterized protein n=1 Tax=Tetrapisispora phaffii (strain ATCC 24235 / CBS 4417 / NBRC 1672 / NRRL Y-8282 / UCD 70-5) TaxID=1071381 RepID=G8BUB9_TETPH|nr:hypothetical protein TPHA_0F02240 [Tetrapisispora phaffii CBS 4417]CCE63705.1 hypothetical protein TPHA_0F02240 [Tetrapisispora phaffii CBS 4417]